MPHLMRRAADVVEMRRAADGSFEALPPAPPEPVEPVYGTACTYTTSSVVNVTTADILRETERMRAKIEELGPLYMLSGYPWPRQAGKTEALRLTPPPWGKL
jgi:hypothetical protein